MWNFEYSEDPISSLPREQQEAAFRERRWLSDLGVNFCVIVGAWWCFDWFLHQLPTWILFFSEKEHRFLGVGILLALSVVLFTLRLLLRSFYGALEIAFGCASAWEALGSVQGDATKWTVMVGATYLFVRGWDNLHEGMDAPYDAKKAKAKADASSQTMQIEQLKQEVLELRKLLLSSERQ